MKIGDVVGNWEVLRIIKSGMVEVRCSVCNVYTKTTTIGKLNQSKNSTCRKCYAKRSRVQRSKWAWGR